MRVRGYQEVMVRRLKRDVMSQLPRKRRQIVRLQAPKPLDWGVLGSGTGANLSSLCCPGIFKSPLSLLHSALLCPTAPTKCQHARCCLASVLPLKVLHPNAHACWPECAYALASSSHRMSISPGFGLMGRSVCAHT